MIPSSPRFKEPYYVVKTDLHLKGMTLKNSLPNILFVVILTNFLSKLFHVVFEYH